MFNHHAPGGYKESLPGIRQKTIAFGDRMLMTEFRLGANSVLPEHAHPHEQTGYLVSGRIRLKIGTEEFDAKAGDAWSIPGGVLHGAQIIEEAVAIEVFSPVRKDYLPTSMQDGARGG